MQILEKISRIFLGEWPQDQPLGCNDFHLRLLALNGALGELTIILTCAAYAN